MIKKTISIIIVALILSSGTAIFADNTTSIPSAATKPVRVITNSNIKARLTQQTQKAKAWAAETKSGLAQINANRDKLMRLEQTSKAVYKSSKNRVKQLMKNKDSLTNEQIDALKQAAAVLTQDKQQMESTIGDIQSENLKLREARDNKDLEAYKKAMVNIITIQKTRIELLKTVIGDMKNIAAM